NRDTLILKRQDDLNISPELMLTRNRGKALQDSIISYRNMLTQIVEGYPGIIANLKTALDVEDPERDKKLDADPSLNYRTWAQENFEASPVIASISLLSKLQIDVCNAESVVLRHLYNQIDASSFKFTGLKATVIPDASYIFQGQEYRARIFLSAEDSTQDLEVYINGSTTKLPIQENEAIFTIRPSQPGIYTYKGEIRYRNPDGEGYGSRFFTQEYEVAVPAVTISPTRMNVLYRNLQNPISISVPGIPSTRLQPTMTNGNITRVGNEWVAEPDELDGDGSLTRIIVNAEVDGQMRNMGEMVFRVKKVPDPRATVAGLSSGNISPQRLQAQVGVFARMDDFDFDLAFEVTSFDMSVPTSGGYTTTLHSNSYRFSEQQQALLNSLVPGDKVWFENIKARIQGNTTDPERILTPVILTVK
ncbi:MAG TPA: GldM family protein, partial [Prolixibacteraceae bacterium]|nr:GldM family protein [Prolixibacteraceae bacterium]